MQGSVKKVIYFCRHAEATHNVKERQAIEDAIASGITDAAQQDMARRAVLQQDDTMDAPLSQDGTQQARASGQKLQALFDASSRHRRSGSSPRMSRHKQTAAPFRRPDVVLVSPLRRALETATQLFYNANSVEDPPLFLAIEALREKRTGLACDERNPVQVLQQQFPHVDFGDVMENTGQVAMGEDNTALRNRVATFLNERLSSIPGQYLAIVSHKGWLRELRQVLKHQDGAVRLEFDLDQWEQKLYGNAEVRVAAFRWSIDGQLQSVISRSVDNALQVCNSMMGDGFEFALGPPSSGFSLFLADRTTKVHFISLAEGYHNVAIRDAALSAENNPAAQQQAESSLLRGGYKSAREHPLYDARLTQKGVQQAKKLRKLLANRPSGGRPFTAFEVVIVSPLTRALETAQAVFSDTPGTYGGEIVPPPRVLVWEDCRERFGRYVFDGRRSVQELQEEFPTFDFSDCLSNEDTLHSDEERESVLDVQERAIQLLEKISARPERCVAVVTHAEFLRHLFGQFGDTLHEEDKSLLQRRTAQNCELRSVVLCSHGAVEREETHAPASTIRVPSSSSISSLAAA